MEQQAAPELQSTSGATSVRLGIKLLAIKFSVYNNQGEAIQCFAVIFQPAIYYFLENKR